MSMSDEYGCGHYRAKFPALHVFDAMSKEGCFVESVKDLTTDELNYSAYIFHRAPSDTLAFHAEVLKKQGKKIVWELDDDLWNIPEWMPSDERNCQWSLNKVLSISDEVWVSTEQLAKKITNKKVKVLPNLIDINAFPKPQKPKDDPIRILWCGGMSHEKDLNILIEPIERLLLEYGSRIQFVFWGYIPDALLEYNRISGKMEAMARPKSEYGEAIWYLEGLPFRYFYDRLTKMRPYIALMPLVDCEFNHAKTNLKYLEMTVAGAASIATKITPYECIDNGIDGVLVNNSTDAWYEAIKNLIENPELRDKMAQNAYQKVYERYSWQCSAKNMWINAFRDLL